jgi:phosphoenolpyruvate carboxykinase (GTP)
MQAEAYGKEPDLPERLFEVLNKQKKGLMVLRENYGPIVTPSQLEEL